MEQGVLENDIVTLNSSRVEHGAFSVTLQLSSGFPLHRVDGSPCGRIEHVLLWRIVRGDRAVG